MNPWRQFANYSFSPYVVASVFSGCVLWKQPNWLPWIYSKLAGEFPGPLYTIMGFVLTAVAIIVATNDSGRMTELSNNKSHLWRQLIQLFIVTAVLSGLFATVLIFLDFETVKGFSGVAQQVVYTVSLFLFSTLVLLFGTSIYALSKFATAPRQNRQTTSEGSHYKVPDYLETEKKEE